MRDYIAFAIPFFFLLIGAELLWARARGVRVYRLSDALTDLSCGVTAQVVALLYTAFLLSLYTWLYESQRLVRFESAWPVWLVAFFGVDFAYYWWHRASHEVNVLWAAHIVHHQSEDYNLAVALRQSVLTSFTSLPFYTPLALLGVPVVPFATVHAFSTLYQFWIHTRLIGAKRGWLDYVFNLPSHHRVHHAINPRYLDKNYGATLIIWDRWFGTFAEEEEVPVYGTTKPLGSFNPWWAQVHYWWELAQTSWRAPRVMDKFRVWWKPPSWHPYGLPVEAHASVREQNIEAHASVRTSIKYEVPVSGALAAYLLVHYAFLIVGATALILYAKQLPNPFLWAAIAAVLLAVLAFGALLERKWWGLPMETLRLIASVALGLSLYLS
jgi:sterol desaturase/sphingolipid hydroxylase (fatty acid hydroxylase superfamily)